MAVTIEDVKKVYKGTISDEDLQIALDTAEMVVSEQLMSCGMSQDRLDKITIYLTAFFADMTATSGAGLPGTLRRQKIGDSDESYAVPLDSAAFYRSNKWGQLAIALDTCNKLINVGTLPAQFRVV